MQTSVEYICYHQNKAVWLNCECHKVYKQGIRRGSCTTNLAHYPFNPARFLFYKESTSRPSTKSSLNVILFSIITGKNITKESIVFYKKSQFCVPYKLVLYIKMRVLQRKIQNGGTTA